MEQRICHECGVIYYMKDEDGIYCWGALLIRNVECGIIRCKCGAIHSVEDPFRIEVKRFAS